MTRKADKPVRAATPQPVGGKLTQGLLAPARAPKREARASAEVPEVGPPERKPDFIWGGQPVYECHLGCGDRYQRVGDLPSVEAHERNEHPSNLRATSLVGPDGKPLIVRVD